ncbi:MAG: DegT/DnrJ/EryC1/StrS aminotransferase family protein [Bacteroidia bacterium]|nr:DegT/DnrJ/EryC1/StrS aminotransferase family protein [Bacteroidota bacterium]MBK7969737.1 DegT/DnrJ/EryC1/StrS aminotransferase family protein [Bacteroidota bacterium]MBK9425628.1 DegT/DnrJ/EryC1/StrS aminotransferase family protein [Bacteroidota bacterium]MBL0071344.1 DegT/DnrJ/EryC1/StrS aminotransferase family protein [Bacteroidota bacterium]MBP9081893.1 DegT/DnrJ/EryC1/StrS aminotransferase family protein [Bacteroidia bacterium]
MMIPFAPPRIDQAIIDEVVAALKSGWITTGPRTKEFEKRLTAYCGNKSTLCLNSATAGLEIMLRWFGVGEGDEVILPAYTYSATANVVVHCGARPVLVDIGSDFNMNVANIKAAVTSKTKVIMPVDFAGLPCDYDAVLNVVNDPAVKSLFVAATPVQSQLGRVLILSDAAHSVGANYKNKKTGALTDVSVFSFHAVKNLTTAEGGAIALNLPEPFDNDEVYKFLCIYTLHGQNKDALAKMQKGNWKYDIIEAGYKCNMTDLCAAIGLVELARYDNDMLVKRKMICDTYFNYFKKFDWAELPVLKDASRETSYHLFPLRIKGITESMRDEIMKRIFDKDVSVNVHFIPLPMLSYYKNMGFNISDYPVAYDTFAREITLPVFYDLTDEQLKVVCNAVEEAVNSVLQEVVNH